jgi:hypothetical protein
MTPKLLELQEEIEKFKITDRDFNSSLPIIDTSGIKSGGLWET